MEFAFTKEQERFRQEVRTFFQTEPRGEIVDLSLNYSPEFYRKAAAKGYLSVHWPKEYNGGGRGPIEDMIFKEEAGYALAPVGIGGVHYTSVGVFGEFIMAYGKEEQKKEYAARIASAEILGSRGFTETHAGQDLAAINTRAVADGDDYIVKGHKQYITCADIADYTLLMVRTGPDSPKEEGISFLIVDLKTPGITLTSLRAMSGVVAFEAFFDDVRVPKRNLVGEENRGWEYITADPRFRYEATAGILIGGMRFIHELLVGMGKATYQDRLLSKEWVLLRHELAELAVEIEVCRLMNYRLSWMRSKGLKPVHEVYMTELFDTQLFRRLANLGTQIFGLASLPVMGSKGGALGGIIETIYEGSGITILPGSPEMLRNGIALKGLGLPAYS